MFLLFQNANQAANQISENTNRDTTEKVFSASQNATNTVIEMINGFFAQLPLIGVGIVVFLVFLVIAYVARKIIRMTADKANIDEMLSSLLARIGYIMIVVFGLFVATVIFPAFSRAI